MDIKLLSKLNIKAILKKISIISFFIWLICIIGVFLTIGYIVGIRKELFDKSPNIFNSFISTLILIGSIAFLISIISFTSQLLTKNYEKRQNIFLFPIKLFFTLTIFPLYLITYILEPFRLINRIRKEGIKNILKSLKIKNVLVKIISLILVCIIVLPIWIVGYSSIAVITANQLGYISKEIDIVGTGSMYPTWEKGTKGKSREELANEIISTANFLPYPNGIVINGKRYLGHTLGRGDIIIWENKATRELTSRDGGKPSGLIKRIIGIPGDTLEIKDGIVYLNGKPLKEPYVAKPRSTFGEKFLKECQVVTVPNNSVFAMGDNRKGSSDSREIGFVPVKDIYLVIPLEKQKGTLDKNWHDASNDLSDSIKPNIDINKFIELLNNKRKEAGAPPVKHEPKLDTSAKSRGKYLLKNNIVYQENPYEEISNEMLKAGYWNSYVWEWTLEGYYTAEELIEDYLERDSTEAKNVWYDKQFEDMGISEVVGELNKCPTQLIVVHAAGYVPPNYDKKIIESWKVSLSRLNEIQPGWASLKDIENFYEENKSDINRINEIINIRISNISKIVLKMEANQWLNANEQRVMREDSKLYYEQEEIANRLNDKLQK